MGKKSAKPSPPASYREAATEIEEILSWIDEEAEVDIDELAGRVERAAELIKFCSERLRSAEMRVEKVTQELAESTPQADAESEE